MLTKLTLRNFKRFDEAVIDLAEPVVLIGPNNSGKTTALQALTLWDVGLRTWLEKRGHGGTSPEKRPGVSINRKDLFSLPIPSALLLWNDLHVRAATAKNGEKGTDNVRIEIQVDGITQGRKWSCGLEFDYANEESIYCRPLRTENSKDPKRMDVPEIVSRIRVAYLPPMSGLADREFAKQPGEIGYLIGQGQTAQVLRNMCYDLCKNNDGKTQWENIVERAQDLFGMMLSEPKLISTRSEITMVYREPNGTELDLSCAGRGLQQTLLLLVFLHSNPGAVLLLDEPDAHLEILRQRQIFNLLTDVAATQGSQIIAASHSEIVLNEAANRGKVIAFVGKPHVINDRGSQALKALTEIGFDQYYQAEQKGWVLYLESITDLDILRTFATTLGHNSRKYLETPFLHPVATNLPQCVRDHFFGLQEAKNDLRGIAIFDRIDKVLQSHPSLTEVMWERREIENYFCMEETLMAYAASDTDDDLFGIGEREKRVRAMRESIDEVRQALLKLGKPEPWSKDIKATDEFLDPLFKEYSRKLEVPLALRKNEYYKLARFVDKSKIDSEVSEKLDAILDVAKKAPIESH
ncbi:MAG: AAA family ATPase [Candidatus Omnitrophica bacterium]|nr:AAA family ATPase [Candidatus Omnitrophota bacterium]